MKHTSLPLQQRAFITLIGGPASARAARPDAFPTTEIGGAFIHCRWAESPDGDICCIANPNRDPVHIVECLTELLDRWFGCDDLREHRRVIDRQLSSPRLEYSTVGISLGLIAPTGSCTVLLGPVIATSFTFKFAELLHRHFTSAGLSRHY